MADNTTTTETTTPTCPQESLEEAMPHYRVSGAISRHMWNEDGSVSKTFIDYFDHHINAFMCDMVECAGHPSNADLDQLCTKMESTLMDVAWRVRGHIEDSEGWCGTPEFLKQYGPVMPLVKGVPPIPPPLPPMSLLMPPDVDDGRGTNDEIKDTACDDDVTISVSNASSS